MELLRTLILVLWAFGCYFLLCECGEMVTSQFEELNGVLGECSWDLFSVEMRKMFIVIAANSQRPVSIRGYGNIMFARRSFKTVCIDIYTIGTKFSLFYSFLNFQTLID